MCIFCERFRGKDLTFDDQFDAEQCADLRARRKRATLITGFLGAGKTTFLNYVLSANHGKKLGVLINEFGETSVDDALIVTAAEEPVVTMANGCVCCKVRDDLVEGLLRLADMDLDGILIEMSGLAEVLPVCQTFFDVRIQEKITLDAVVAVVDGTCLEGAAEDIRVEQLLLADAVLLNKMDRLPAKERKERVAAAQLLAPNATIIPCRNGQVNLDQVLNLDSFALTGDLFSRKPSHLHHSFQSQSLTCESPLDVDALLAFLKKIIEEKNILRCKGVILVKDATGKTATMVVQGVGAHIDVEFVHKDIGRSLLVLIGPKLELSADVDEAFARCAAP